MLGKSQKEKDVLAMATRQATGANHLATVRHNKIRFGDFLAVGFHAARLENEIGDTPKPAIGGTEGSQSDQGPSVRTGINSDRQL